MQNAGKNAKIAPFHDLGKIKMMKQEATIPNTIFKSTVIIPKTTLDNVKEGPEKAVAIGYDKFDDYINEHKDELFKKNGRYKMVILTEAGWRSGVEFQGNDYDLYDPSFRYDDKEDTINSVYAVQIITI